jgi:hypothetical protein
MKNFNFRFVLSAIALYSIMMAATTAKAAPVQFNQVVQVVNAKPGKANNGAFTQLHLVGDEPILKADDTPKTETPQTPQDNRVITEIKTEIVEDDVCDCIVIPPVVKGFPYGWLALGGVPLLFLIPNGDDKTPTPTPPVTTETPTPTTMTPTPTPTPEPVTILLFGTGLASIGFAARRRFGKKDESEDEAV